MRLSTFILFLAITGTSFSQTILIGYTFNEVIEVLETNHVNFEVDLDVDNMEIELKSIIADWSFIEIEYLFLAESDMCVSEYRDYYGISFETLYKHLDSRHIRMRQIEWLDYSSIYMESGIIIPLIHRLDVTGKNPLWVILLNPNTEPETSPEYTGRSKARLLNGDISGAISDFDQAKSLSDEYPFVEFEEVMEVLTLTGEQSAMQMLHKKFPGMNRGAVDYYFIATRYTLSGQFTDGIKNFTNALEIDPGFDMAYNLRGQTYQLNGDYGKAIADYDIYIGGNPSDLWVIKQRADAKLNSDDYVGAFEDYEIYLAANPEDVELMLYLGFQNYNFGEYEKALGLLNKVLALNPEERNAWIYKGLVYSELSDSLENAVTFLTRAIDIDPAFFLTYYYRGNAYSEISKPVNAIQDFTTAIDMDPTFIDSYFMRALEKAALGDKLGTIEDYKELLSWEGKSEPIRFLWGSVYNNKGNTLMELGRYEEARPLIDKALELEPEEDYIWSTRGELHYLTGDYEKCIIDMDMAIELSNSGMSKAPGLGHEVSYYYRGLAKIKIGNTEAGCSDLHNSQRLGNPDAAHEITRWCD